MSLSGHTKSTLGKSQYIYNLTNILCEMQKYTHLNIMKNDETIDEIMT